MSKLKKKLLAKYAEALNAEMMTDVPGDGEGDPAIEMAEHPAGKDETGPDQDQHDPAEIVIGVDEARINDDIERALGEREKNLFQRTNRLVAVAIPRPGKKGRRSGNYSIIVINPAWIRDKITKHCRFVKRSFDGDLHAYQQHSVHPSDWMATNLVARTEHPNIRELVGVATYPILTVGGVRAEAGYDETSGWLLLGLPEMPQLNLNPSAEDIKKAKALLHEAVMDFPFAHPAGEAAWIALLLTALARPAIDGPTPLILIEASVAGAGKGKLLIIIGIILTGAPLPVIPEVKDCDELRKQITAILFAADPIAQLDDVSQLSGAALNALLTSTVWRDRLLGKTEIVTLQNHTVWTATGNNVEIRGDTVRRILPVRLEPQVECPEDRTGFAHPDLEAWVREMRGELLAAATTLLAGYEAAGRPEQALPPWGSFEAWSRLVRGCLVWAGYPDPLECRIVDTFQENSDTTKLGSLLRALRTLGPRKARELLDLAKEGKPDSDVAGMILDLAVGPKGEPSAGSLGKRLDRWRGRVVVGLQFKTMNAGGGVKAYYAAPISSTESGDSGDRGFNSSLEQIHMKF